MSKPNNKNDKNSLPVDVARDFIELQKKEMQVRADEVAIRSKEIENSHEYAMKALEAQKNFYQNAPTERRKDRWQMFWICAFGFILVVAFFIYLFSSGNGEFAKETIKYLIGALFGGSAGYGIGSRKSRKNQEEVES